MIRCSLFVYVVLATSLTSAAVHRDREDLCSSNEFTCSDGSCVPLARLCDGKRDCADASDESVCFLPSRNNTDLSLLGRAKRQATCHPKNQWQCRDGTCISFDGECDGVVDCPDGSDETYPRCRGKECQANWFRCTYGACVDGTAACNGVQDCADNSDELDPSCRTETDEANGQFKCQNGQLISAANRCDGIADCADYSDESVRACAGRTCPSNLFQCAYGACVDQGSDCNGKTECADGSDESLELCDKTATVTTTTRPGGTPVRPGPKPSTSGSCILPQYPDHGTYKVTNSPSAAPGQRFDSVYINVVCDPGYKVSGPSEIFCLGGQWSGSIANCVRFCKLNKHSSVEYKCLLTGGTNKGTRDCEDFEPVGTVAIPVCRTPDYYSPNVLNYMHCFEGGEWDYVAVCTPGLSKNGTNITVLIKDKVEVYVSTFVYSGAPPSSVVTPITPAVAENQVEYDISTDDWRMASVVNKINRNNNVKTNKIKMDAVNLYIKNSAMVVNSDDRVHFPED